jgi:hypothetical protein
VSLAADCVGSVTSSLDWVLTLVSVAESVLDLTSASVASDSVTWTIVSVVGLLDSVPGMEEVVIADKMTRSSLSNAFTADTSDVVGASLAVVVVAAVVVAEAEEDVLTGSSSTIASNSVSAEIFTRFFFELVAFFFLSSSSWLS